MASMPSPPPKIKVMKWISSFVVAVFFTIPLKSTVYLFKSNESAPVITDTVTVTTYTTDTSETDEEPLITASGFKLDSLNPKRHKIIAVSRDLKKRYPFGSKVRVKGLGKKYDGVYKVEDVMHSRWRKKIDLLINPKDKQFKKRRVVITPIEK
jgi:3D (Asp-Asp-Asp) domain-containing protein